MNQKRRAAANFLLGKFNAAQTQEVFEILGMKADEARRVVANLESVVDTIEPKIPGETSAAGTLRAA